MSAADSTPVIIGIGQSTWREPDYQRTPTEALVDAARKALDDCGKPAVTDLLDAVVNVRFVADTNPAVGALFPRNPGATVAHRLGITNAACYLGAIGGNTPQYLVNRFAEKLVRGEQRGVLLCGAELMSTFFSAMRKGGDISDWAGAVDSEPPTVGEERDGLNAQETAHGLYEPINTYPLFENSLRHHLGLDREAHTALIAGISARMSAVAANNPLAWRREAMTAEQIATVETRNRYIGYPYTRAMNAVLEVDMAAAVIMTTAANARALGIPSEQWVYLRGGIDINDIWYPSERADWHSSPAIELGWKTLAQACRLNVDDLSHFDIYSCFPSAVQIACAAIGISPMDERDITVTGGLPFFGGPGNNYSLHAIAEMVARLRRESGTALVTANGLYLTKHSLGLYTSEPVTATPALPETTALQQRIDRGPGTALAADPAGEATVETYTVAFDRHGPRRGILVARNDAGERVVANSEDSEDVLNALLAEDPIGRRGAIRVNEGINIMTL